MISNSFAEYMFCSAWTSVEEKLPDKKGWYIVSCDPRYLPTDGVELVDIFAWDGDKWVTVDVSNSGFEIIVKDECPVVAWMPLPKPYLVWDENLKKCFRPI